MITNRELPHVVQLIDALPERYKGDVKSLLDELERGIWVSHNPEYVGFSKYKIRIAGGDVELIVEAGISLDVRIVDIKVRPNIRGILRKIGHAIDKIDIGPKG